MGGLAVEGFGATAEFTDSVYNSIRVFPNVQGSMIKRKPADAHDPLRRKGEQRALKAKGTNKSEDSKYPSRTRCGPLDSKALTN